MALPNELVNPLPESLEASDESFKRAFATYLQEMQTSLENIERMRRETEPVRAASDSLIQRILNEVEQRIQIRKQEIAQLNAENEILRAKLLAG